MLRNLIESEIRNMLTENEPRASEPAADFGSSYKIVIAQRGFVFAGDCTREGDYIMLTDAVNVRRWGTTKGLGELSQFGNRPETKADDAGTVRLHQLAVVAMIDCKERISATA